MGLLCLFGAATFRCALTAVVGLLLNLVILPVYFLVTLGMSWRTRALYLFFVSPCWVGSLSSISP